MADTPENRLAAEKKAIEINLDIISGNFDPSLKKYRTTKHLTVIETIKPKPQLLLGELWNKYCEYKAPSWKRRTYCKMTQELGKHVHRCPYQDMGEALDIRKWLLEATTSDQAKTVLMHLSAICNWGIKHKFVYENPFAGMYQELPRFKYQQEPSPNAFSSEERETIINAFKQHSKKGRSYRHYAPFVEFLFLTGCRPSEAVGLTWDCISEDFSFVRLHKALVQVDSSGRREESEGSKNNKKRKFNCNERLRNLLINHQPDNYQADDLVFPSPDGLSIHYRNFSRRAWDKVVDPIVQRPTTPYSCRDTFITEQIAKGVPTVVVAKWVDNTVRQIEERYLDLAKLEQLRPL
jgi:integrase